MAFTPGNLFRPLAPGLPGAVNPLAMIGAGMASGDLGGALGNMGRLSLMAQQEQRAAQQAQQEAAFQRFRMEQIQLQNKRRQAEMDAMKALAPTVAKQVFPGMANMEAYLAGSPQLMNAALGSMMPQAPAAPTEKMRNLAATGAEPGTPEYEQDMRRLMGLEEAPKAAEFKDVATVRQRYTKASQPWQESRRAFERIMATEPTGAGDIALLTSYMKVLDPGSTVREGEFATAEQTGGAPDWVRNLYNRLLTGERLNPEQRQQFKSQAAGFLDARRREQQKTQEQFTYWANQRGMDLREAVPDYLGQYGQENWRNTLGVPTYSPQPRPPEGVPTSGDPEVDDLMKKYLGP